MHSQKRTPAAFVPFRDRKVLARVRAIKREVPGLLVMTDVCNCEYTSHGHCGYIKDGDVDNDTTLQWLAKSALSHARAGADVVAPSDMMDGRVWAIRQALDRSRRALERDAHMRALHESYSSLTPREREVMECVVKGQTSKEVGRTLDVSPRTVEIHRTRIMDKMQAGSLAELVRMVAVLEIPLTRTRHAQK